MPRRKKKSSDVDGSELTGEESIFSLLSQTTPLSQTTEWLNTLLPSFDMLLTRGKGVPYGKIIEIYGKEASGKTALTQYLLGRVQAEGGWGVYVDFEESFDEEHTACYDVNNKRVFYSVPDTLDELFLGLFDFLDKASGKYEPFIIIIDSLASAIAESEKADDAKVQVAPVPRVMSRNLRKLVVRLAGKRGFVVFINQLRDKIGVVYGERTTRPGGRALDFHAHTIIQTYVKETLYKTVQKKKIPTGFLIVATNKKNKKGIPKTSSEIILSFTTGIDLAQTMFHSLTKERKIIKKKGSFYMINGEEFTKAQILLDIGDNPKKFYKLFMKGENDV